MHQKSTLDELILYYYNETQLTENVLIQNDIDHNEETAAMFEDIKKAASLMNELLEKPSPRCKESILSYSRVTL
jgi:hypothetical protein